jgi:hypothetical protein
MWFPSVMTGWRGHGPLNGHLYRSPILRSEELVPALRRALHAVKVARRPTVVYVVTQNR